MRFQFGSDIVGSYRRLAYKPWHAIGEFVDNATQSYFDNRELLDASYNATSDVLTVRIVYENGLLRVFDNAMGMNESDLERALYLARAPEHPTGRSRYGLGMKTAAFWIGNKWSIRTKKLGDTVEHTVTISLDKIIAGDLDLTHQKLGGRDPNDHYTIVEVTDHNQSFKGKTLGKIEDYIRSMYRQDIRSNTLLLEWRGKCLDWEDPVLLINAEGNPFYKGFEFEVEGKQVRGWVGILERGSRAKAGFSILQSGRVIRGWPDAWRPRELFGQEQGSNDLVNQRLVGEIHLDEFEVSHTKDDIQWLGDQEDLVETGLLEHCRDYRSYAQEYRPTKADGRGPSEAATSTAIDELRRELESPEMVDQIDVALPLPQEAVKDVFDTVVENAIESREATLRANVGPLSVVVYVLEDMSPNDPYVASQPSQDKVIVIVNKAHPHWIMLDNVEVANYLRHCIYDAIAEWQARSKLSRLDPDTIKLLKDQLLRIPYSIEQHAATVSDA